MYILCAFPILCWTDSHIILQTCVRCTSKKYNIVFIMFNNNITFRNGYYYFYRGKYKTVAGGVVCSSKITRTFIDTYIIYISYVILCEIGINIFKAKKKNKNFIVIRRRCALQQQQCILLLLCVRIDKDFCGYGSNRVAISRDDPRRRRN